MKVSVHDGSIELKCPRCNNSIQTGEIIYQVGDQICDSPNCLGLVIENKAMHLRDKILDVLFANDKESAVPEEIELKDTDFDIFNKERSLIVCITQDCKVITDGVETHLNKYAVIKTSNLEIVYGNQGETLFITTYDGKKMEIPRKYAHIPLYY